MAACEAAVLEAEEVAECDGNVLGNDDGPAEAIKVAALIEKQLAGCSAAPVSSR